MAICARSSHIKVTLFVVALLYRLLNIIIYSNKQM
jgi:hypothetical protein